MNNKNENTFASSSSSANEIILLPKEVIELLQQGIDDGFPHDHLNLARKRIDDHMVSELCNWIAKLEGKIKKLDLHKNKLCSDGVITLCQLLKRNHLSIQSLVISGNQVVDDKCMKAIGEYIKESSCIQGLYLGSNYISDKGLEALAAYLEGNITIKALDLFENKNITDKSIPYVIKIIETSRIEFININQTSITNNNVFVMPIVDNVIKYGSGILNLSATKVNDDHVVRIGEILKKHGVPKLKELNLNGNEITSNGAMMLMESLIECGSVLAILNLSRNQIDDECMKKIGEFVNENEYLEGLALSNNKISDKGIEILSSYLIGNTMLNDLYVASNKDITDASVPYLLEAVKMSNITSIYVADTPVTKSKRLELQNTLKIPPKKREIPIKSNAKSAAKSIAKIV